MNLKIKIIRLILFFLSLLFLWQVLYTAKFWPSWLFPSPSMVSYTIIKGFAQQNFLPGILVSLRRVFLGFGLSVLAGTLLGFLLAKVSWLKQTLGFLILGLQTLPSLCWLPLALLWFGLNERAILFVIIMGSLLSITISVESAVKNIPPNLLHIARLLGARGFKMYRHVIIPAILPAYLNGLKQGWSFAWRSLMSAEMLFISVGLGQLLMFGRELNDMALVISIMLIIICLGILFDYCFFGWLEKKVRQRWGLS